MSLYIRYFDSETLVHSIDEALDFLASLQEIEMTEELEKDLRSYVNSDQYYPKKYKVRQRFYFIVIKTEAETLQDFKDKKALRKDVTQSKSTTEMQLLTAKQEGWYEGSLEFKRVITNHLGKCEYRDTSFTAQCKASSPMECYQIIIQHLQTRVDKRSQFPSAKGKNFICHFLGKCKE